jgi:hypothetical protein
VASQADHLTQARRNRDFAGQLLENYPNDLTALQWAVTVAFYCAVHCIEAHLAGFGTPSRSHEERRRRMLDPRHNIPANVYAAYRQLERYSRGARYSLQQFTAGDVQANILGRYLATVTRFVGL